VQNDPGLSHRQILWNTGAKFFKRFLKNFEEVELTPCEPSLPDTRKAEKEIQNSASTYIALHTGAKFFYLQEVRKICLTLHTGANFSIFVEKNWKNLESHSNGPREGASPNDDETGLEKRVSPNDDKSGPL
jgi:hypothetical protein